MWLQFFSQNAHFVINLFAALACMGICWLYFDAWSNRHALKELFKWTGFAALGASFLFQATIIEQSVLGKSLLGHWTVGLVIASRVIAYTLIVLGQITDPLQAVPKNTGLALDEDAQAETDLAAKQDAVIPTKIAVTNDSSGENNKAAAILPIVSLSTKLLLPFGGLAIAGLYWRRATTGLERHLKPVAKAFLLFAISDAIALVSLLRTTSNPLLYTWVAAFGWIWWLQQLALLGGVVILGLWTWSYLLERFFSQLFMIFSSMVVIVFMVVSVGFTGLLLRNIQSDTLVNLKTAANVLNYALTAKQGETASAAAQLAGSSDVATSIGARDREKLNSLTTDYLSDKKLTGLIITNQSGQVLLRAEDTDQWGDSLSGDALVKRALLGLNQSTISVLEGVGSPSVHVRSAVAVKDATGNVVGSIVTSLALDSAFVDGIKQSTGLQSSVYGASTLAATTLTTANGKTRSVGVKLSDANIKNQVLVSGKSYSGVANLQNRQMLAVFLPIKDVDNASIGMLLIAQPQSSILATAGHSVELTFLITAALLLLSILPIYYIVKSLTKQLT